MTTKATQVPLGLIALNERMFAGPDKPIALYHQKAAGHLLQANVLSARDLAGVFCQPPPQRRLESLARVYQPPPLI